VGKSNVRILGLSFLLLVSTGWLFADESRIWVLQAGPEEVQAIPLTPLQPVESWRGLYQSDAASVWVYLTQSPFFFPPNLPSVQKVANSNWWVIAFAPAKWPTRDLTAWLDRWVSAFQVVESLPNKGYPLVLPSVLR